MVFSLKWLDGEAYISEPPFSQETVAEAGASSSRVARQNSERKALIDWLRRLRFLKRISRRRIRFSRILSDSPIASCLTPSSPARLCSAGGRVFQTYTSLRCSWTDREGGENGWRVFVKPSRIPVNPPGVGDERITRYGTMLN